MEVVAEPATVGFGSADKPGWTAVRRIVLRNVSTRRVDVDVAAATEAIAGLSVTAAPARVRLQPGASAPVKLTARVAFLPRRVGAIQGRARLEVSGGGRVIVPWAVALPFKGSALIGGVGMSPRSFRASDRAPAVLTVQAGQVRDLAGRRQLRPVSRLDVELWRGGERLGLVARLRDVLPGRYAFGVTGRGPRGGALRERPLSPAGARRAARRPGRGRDRPLQDPLTREGYTPARLHERRRLRCPRPKSLRIFARTRSSWRANSCAASGRRSRSTRT